MQFTAAEVSIAELIAQNELMTALNFLRQGLINQPNHPAQQMLNQLDAELIAVAKPNTPPLPPLVVKQRRALVAHELLQLSDYWKKMHQGLPLPISLVTGKPSFTKALKWPSERHCAYPCLILKHLPNASQLYLRREWSSKKTMKKQVL